MVYPPRRVKAVTFAAEKRGVSKGMLGGIVMMVIAAVWFFVALAAGVIFFYPPVLFVIGLYAFLKGLFTGNIAGKRAQRPRSRRREDAPSEDVPSADDARFERGEGDEDQGPG